MSALSIPGVTKDLYQAAARTIGSKTSGTILDLQKGLLEASPATAARLQFQKNVIIGLGAGLVVALPMAANFIASKFIWTKTPSVTLRSDTQETLNLLREKTQKAETAEQKALTCAADLQACLSSKGTVEGEKSQVQQMLDSVKGNLDNCVSQKSNLEKAIPSYQNMTQAAEADLADCLASLEACANGGEVV